MDHSALHKTIAKKRDAEANKNEVKVKRRSLVQKQKRDLILEKQRNLSPLKERTRTNAQNGMKRKEQLKAWKEERKKKKDQEKRKAKPTFKVTSVLKRDDNLFSMSRQLQTFREAPAGNTRSQTRTVRQQKTSNGTTKNGPNELAAAKKRVHASKTAKSAREINQTKQNKENMKTNKTKVPEQFKDSELGSEALVIATAEQKASYSVKRESFAPQNFSFKAPMGLKRFSFELNSNDAFVSKDGAVNPLRSTPVSNIITKQKTPALLVLSSDTVLSDENTSQEAMVEIKPPSPTGSLKVGLSDNNTSQEAMAEIKPASPTGSLEVGLSDDNTSQEAMVEIKPPSPTGSLKVGLSDDNTSQEAMAEIKPASPTGSLEVGLSDDNTSQEAMVEIKPPSPTGSLEEAQNSHSTSFRILSQETEKGEKVQYFRNLIITENAILTSNCKKWEQEQEKNESLSEEVIGEFRTVIGQARLLMTDRFVQFSGLIDKFENPKPDHNLVTPADLKGFWEMIYYQVEDVAAKFKNLETLKERNWQKVEETKKKVTRKRKGSTKWIKESSDHRQAARKRIKEAREAMTAKLQQREEKSGEGIKLNLDVENDAFAAKYLVPSCTDKRELARRSSFSLDKKYVSPAVADSPNARALLKSPGRLLRSSRKSFHNPMSPFLPKPSSLKVIQPEPAGQVDDLMSFSPLPTK